MNEQHYRGKRLTMVTQNKESAGAEVAVELQQDVIGCAGNGLLGRASTELTDLRGCLVRAVPTGNKVLFKPRYEAFKTFFDFFCLLI